MKKIILIALAVVVLGLVVVSILRGGGKAEATVEDGKVARKDLTATVDCSGTIEPKRKVDVSANAMGTIVNLAVREGQRVEPENARNRPEPGRIRIRSRECRPRGFVEPRPRRHLGRREAQTARGLAQNVLVRVFER